jgi:hypothetical protein
MGGSVSSCFRGSARHGDRHDDTNSASSSPSVSASVRPPKGRPAHATDTAARSEGAGGHGGSGAGRGGDQQPSGSLIDAAPQGVHGAGSWTERLAATPELLNLNGHAGLLVPAAPEGTPRSMLLSACTPCAVTLVCLRTGAVLERNTTSTFYFGSLQHASTSTMSGRGPGSQQYNQPDGEPPLLDALFSMQPEMLPEMLAAVSAGHIWEASMRVPAGSLSPPLLQLPLPLLQVPPQVLSNQQAQQLLEQRPHRRTPTANATAPLGTVDEDLNAEAFDDGCTDRSGDDATVSLEDLIVLGMDDAEINEAYEEQQSALYAAAGAHRFIHDGMNATQCNACNA